MVLCSFIEDDCYVLTMMPDEVNQIRVTGLSVPDLMLNNVADSVSTEVSWIEFTTRATQTTSGNEEIFWKSSAATTTSFQSTSKRSRIHDDVNCR